jgi:site-specific DNA-methyltransferase (cytosine-N4-specific)
MSTLLEWRNYRYFDYEREFARREVIRLFGSEPSETKGGLVVAAEFAERGGLDRLTYFSRVSLPGGGEVVPLQTRLERSASPQQKDKQSTRYSAHGLHEYKGKFNPQVVRAICNMLGLRPDAWILDPFCGSGTTLLEAAHAGWNGLGLDRNPLAVKIANAKLRALRLANGPLERWSAELETALSPFSLRMSHADPVPDADLDFLLGRGWDGAFDCRDYLAGWFPRAVLAQCVVFFRHLRNLIPDAEDRSVFEILLSDQLRDASWQEPADLRIRRRKQPADNYPLLSLLVASMQKTVPRIAAARAELGEVRGWQNACLADACDVAPRALAPERRTFDALVTSPPYATALPYIDTQRLSLVLLGLIGSGEIRSTEVALVGAREIGTSERAQLERELLDPDNTRVPTEVLDLCRDMHAAARLPGNGFRRQNMPSLVYRYFRDMAAALRTVRSSLTRGAPAALVVGSNRSTLGGREFAIDTPVLLASVGRHVGYSVDSLVPMNTYPRYDLHQQNSINEEMLVLLRA